MSGLVGILSYGIGTLLGFALIGLLVFWFVQDITQKKHTVLRNYPLIGRLRYFFEKQGEYFRQYFFAGDRDEMPFNRATRGWVYRLAKDEAASSASARPTISASLARSFSSMRPFQCWRKIGFQRLR